MNLSTEKLAIDKTSAIRSGHTITIMEEQVQDSENEAPQITARSNI